eukprot:3941441-Rhodomonas_salina.8
MSGTDLACHVVSTTVEQGPKWTRVTADLHNVTRSHSFLHCHTVASTAYATAYAYWHNASGTNGDYGATSVDGFFVTTHPTIPDLDPSVFEIEVVSRHALLAYAATDFFGVS